ncbi:MAG: hypothetical protein KDJ63_13920, partial [Nitratireductor sp.]|nr:hypothetical protein [Nitratireductor sp.]
WTTFMPPATPQRRRYRGRVLLRRLQQFLFDDVLGALQMPNRVSVDRKERKTFFDVVVVFGRQIPKSFHFPKSRSKFFPASIERKANRSDQGTESKGKPQNHILKSIMLRPRRQHR